MSTLMLRAQRTAKRVPQGDEILAFLGGAKARKALLAVAETGNPPVTAISEGIVSLVQPKNRKLMQVRQFVGLAIRAILEQEGFEIDRTGVWLGNDPVFSTASTYRKVSMGRHNKDLLSRFADSLTKDEAAILFDLLGRRLK